MPALASRYCVTTVEAGKLRLSSYAVGANWGPIIG